MNIIMKKIYIILLIAILLIGCFPTYNFAQLDISDSDLTSESVKPDKTNITINKSLVHMQAGAVTNILSTAFSYNTSEEEIEWTSSNPSIASLEKAIDEGTYYIKSAIDESKVIDVKAGSVDNKAAIQIYNNNGSDAQKWLIQKNSDNTYTIKSKKSGKVLDIVNGGTARGTKIQQYNSNGSNAQKWKFQDAGNGYYYIKSISSGLYLDVTGGNAVNGTQLEIWTANSSNAQMFKLDKLDKLLELQSYDQMIEHGTYYIRSALDESKVFDVKSGSMDNKAAIQIYNNNGSDAQKFEIINIGNNYYTIKSKQSGKVLDIVNGGKTKGTKIQQYNSNFSDAQIWQFEDAGNGYYYIKSKLNGLYLDINDAKAVNGVQLQVWTQNKTDSQKFKLEKIDAIENPEKMDLSTINARSTGAATITAKTNKGQAATCTIIVNSLTLNNTNVTLELRNKETTNLTATVLSDTKEGINKWTSSNPKVATVTKSSASSYTNSSNTWAYSETATITAKTYGTTTITVESNNGMKATCIVKVNGITGGQAIAEAAVKLACTVGPSESRFKVEWATTKTSNKKAAYYIQQNLRLLKEEKPYYASCDRAAATAIRLSGVDKKFNYNTTIYIWKYLQISDSSSYGTKKNGWIKIGKFKRGTDSLSKLKVGDVLLSGSPYYGHIWLYTGNEVVKMKYPTSTANGYEAGYNSTKGQSYYPHLFNISSDQKNRIEFTIFRNEHYNDKIYNKVL